MELHEREFRSFLETWNRFAASGRPMPEAHGDEVYADRERPAGHVFMAARGYLTRIGEWVNRPVTDVDGSRDPREIMSRAAEFSDGVLATYRRHMAEVTTEEIEPQIHRTRWSIRCPIASSSSGSSRVAANGPRITVAEEVGR